MPGTPSNQRIPAFNIVISLVVMAIKRPGGKILQRSYRSPQGQELRLRQHGDEGSIRGSLAMSPTGPAEAQPRGPAVRAARDPRAGEGGTPSSSG